MTQTESVPTAAEIQPVADAVLSDAVSVSQTPAESDVPLEHASTAPVGANGTEENAPEVQTPQPPQDEQHDQE